MEPHESRDLDDVIDDVARTMTSGALARDLRPAIAARLEAPSRRLGWSLWWRPAMAVAAGTLLVVTVAVMSRPFGEPPQTRRAAVPDAQPRMTLSDEQRIAPSPAPAASQPARRERRVARQTIVHTTGTEDIVVIPPMTIVPLEQDDVTTATPGVPQVVTIAPIDVEPVRIRALGDQVE